MDKKYEKSCEFCGITIQSSNFLRHINTRIHKNNKYLYYDNIKFPNIVSTEQITFNDIIHKEVIIDSSVLNIRLHSEYKHIIKTNNGNIILDRYDKSQNNNFYIGIKYTIKEENEFCERYKNKNNIIGRQVFTIDLENKIAIVTTYQT